jgi:hypothetical protein
MKYDTTYSIINISSEVSIQLGDESNYKKWYDIIFNYCFDQGFNRFTRQELAVEKIIKDVSTDDVTAWQMIHFIDEMDSFMTKRHTLNCAVDYEKFSQKLTKAFMMML